MTVVNAHRSAWLQRTPSPPHCWLPRPVALRKIPRINQDSVNLVPQSFARLRANARSAFGQKLGQRTGAAADMARQINRLTTRTVATAKKPGLRSDGAGLQLRISCGRYAGERRVFIYRRPSDGKRCDLGLGSANTVILSDARRKAAEVRAQIADGIDPRSATMRATAE